MPDKACQCAACCSSQCGCPDADWTPKEVYVLRKRIAELEGALKYYMRECPCNHGGPCDCLIAKQALSPKEKESE